MPHLNFKIGTPGFWKMILRTIMVTMLFVAFNSCELPDTTDELEHTIPAVWAVFSPEESAIVYITSVEPYDGGDSQAPHSSWITGAEIQIEWLDSSIAFHDTAYVDWSYEDTIRGYIPDDAGFDVISGGTYTLSGNTSIGSFSGSFTVPEIQNVWIAEDTAYFSQNSDWAFAVSVSGNSASYEVWPRHLVDLGDYIHYYGEESRPWWKTEEMPDTFAVGWYNFYEEGMYELNFRAGDSNFREYIEYYKYADYDENEDDYRSPPGGEGYTGVIGAYVKEYKTVWVFIE